MSIVLPAPIAAYFSADKNDSKAIAGCFTADAVVKDEGRTYQGHAAIEQWKATSSTKYSYTSEPFACEASNGKTIVTSRVTGNFPGSPVDLRYIFGLEGDRIAALQITV